MSMRITDQWRGSFPERRWKARANQFIGCDSELCAEHRRDSVVSVHRRNAIKVSYARSRSNSWTLQPAVAAVCAAQQLTNLAVSLRIAAVTLSPLQLRKIR